MKNTFKLGVFNGLKVRAFGIIALVAIIGIGSAGCVQSTSSGGLSKPGDPPPPGGNTISGKVDLDSDITGTVYAYEGTDLLGQAVLTGGTPYPWSGAQYSWTITLSKPAMNGIAFVVGVNDTSAVGGELRSRKYVVEDLREWNSVIWAEGYKITGDYFHDGRYMPGNSYFSVGNGFYVVPQGSDEEIGNGEVWAGRPVSFILDPKNPLSEFDPYPALTIEPQVDITGQIVDGGVVGGDSKVARVDFVMPEHDITVKINFIPHYDPDKAAIKGGYYEAGYVLPLNTATQGSGVNLVLYGDGWKHSDLAEKGNWETAARESLKRFFALPVIRDFKAYFNVYALMVESSKTVQELNDSGEYKFPEELIPYLVRQMPQIRGKEAETTIFYIANGPAGGYMTELDGFSTGVYSYDASETKPQYCIFHEIMGHAFAKLGDEYGGGAAADIASIISMQNGGFGLNCSLNSTWNTVPWKDFLGSDGKGITGYGDMGIFEGGFVYTTGVWRSIEHSVMRDNSNYDTSGWQRYLVYKRIMDLAGVPCTMADFFTYDAPNTLITDWAEELEKTVTLP